MRDLVLDASAALRMVLRMGDYEQLIGLLSDSPRVIAPRLYLPEVANGLWKYVRSGDLAESEALDLLEEAAALVTFPIDDEEIVTEAFAEAVRYEHPVYDAMYAVLARRVGGRVVTRDERLAELLNTLKIEAV